MVDHNTAVSMAQHLAARSRKHQDVLQNHQRPMPTAPMLSRVGRLWSIGRSKAGGMLMLRIAALLTSIVVQVWTNDASALNYGTMVACLMSLDKAGFIRAMGWSCTLAVVETLWWEIMWGMMREVGRHLGNNIQDDLIRRVAAKNMYRLTVHFCCESVLHLVYS